MAYTEFELIKEQIDKLPNNKEAPQYALAAIIESNLEDEANATRKYCELLTFLTDAADIANIREIISDELNHQTKLRVMFKKYSGIIEAKD